jgi:hypothetical protein
MNTYDTYKLDKETWRVLDDAEQCLGCAGMSFIFSDRFGPQYCIGCSDQLEQVLKVI